MKLKPVTRIVAYGDSISQVGRGPTWFGGASCREMNYAQQLGRLLAEAYPRVRFEVEHFGIGGQNAYEGLGRLDGLAAFRPDWVLVAFGANDCGYHFLPPEATQLALETLIDAIRSRYGAEVLVLCTGGDNPAAPRFVHLDETVAATRKAAERKGAPFVDIRAAVLAATHNGACWTDFHNGLQDCHPNDRGHAVWARAVFDVIRASRPAEPGEAPVLEGDQP